MRKRAVWMLAAALWTPALGVALTAGAQGHETEVGLAAHETGKEQSAEGAVPDPVGWGARGLEYRAIKTMTATEESRHRGQAVSGVSDRAAGPGIAATEQREAHRRAKELMRRDGGGMPDWQELFLMGAGLCAGSGFCVYRAARVKRNGLIAKVLPMQGGVTA